MLITRCNQSACKKNETNISLEETLRPLWKLTYYGGILLDWCHPISNPHPILRVMQYASITIFSSLIFCVMLFELIQLFIEIENMPNIHTVIPNLIWFIPFLLAIPTHIYYLRRRRDLLMFFEDWQLFERKFTESESGCLMCNSKRIHLIMYAVYVVMTVGSLVSLGFEISNNPTATYLISTYKCVRETVSLYLIGSIHLSCILIVWIILSLSDFVPAFVYYHSALAVSCLERDAKKTFLKLLRSDEVKYISPLFVENLNQADSCLLKRSFKQPRDRASSIRLIWVRFESLNQMVGRANYLFGFFMVYGYLVSVFMVTTLLYSVLYNLEDALKMRFAGSIVAYLLNFIAMIVRFTSCTILSSQLYRSVEKFSISLNFLLSQHWEELSRGERELLRSFISRLQSDHLVASPLGLFTITTTTFLTVFGLVVSYVIVLLQSK